MKPRLTCNRQKKKRGAETIKNTLRYEILSYLNKSGGIPRKNLYTPFAQSNYKYYARTLSEMIKQGQIEVYRYKQLNHVRITEAGKVYLSERKVEEIKRSVNKEQKKPRNKKAEKRLSLVNDVRGLCEGCGFLVDDKPDLARLMSNYEYSREEWSKAENQGVFYTTGEIRKAYMATRGKNELMNMARLIGVVILKGHLSYVYAIGDKLIKWLDTNERRTVEAIESFLCDIEPIKRSIKDSTRNAIIVGRGYAMIPKLVTGRRFGKIEEGTKERFRAVIAKDHINAHNLGKVFDSAYYVQASRQGISPFRIAALLSEDTREYVINQWYDTATGIRRVKGNQYTYGLNSAMERVVYLPFVNLIELEYYRNQGEAAHFVLEKQISEAISRSVGPLWITMRDLQGNRLNPKRYDKNGYLIDDNRKEREPDEDKKM